MRIYIADDSSIVRKRLSTMLAEVPGIELTGKAADADQAYEEIRRLEPEIVILDLRMPGDGASLLRRVKSLTRMPLVIVLTNYSSEPYRRHSLEAGADYFLDKSTDQEQLLRILYTLAAAPGQRPA